MLGGLLQVGSALAAVARLRGSEGPVATVTVLKRLGAWRGFPNRGGGQWGRQEGGEAVGEEARRVGQRLGQVGDESAAYGVGVGIAFEPGGDGGGQSADVALGQQQSGLVTAQAREEVGGRAVAVEVGDLRLGKRRARYGCGGVLRTGGGTGAFSGTGAGAGAGVGAGGSGAGRTGLGRGSGAAAGLASVVGWL